MTYIKENSDTFTNQDHTLALLEKAKTVVAMDSDYIFYNCEVRIVGPNIEVTFKAGKPKNIYLVHVNISFLAFKCKLISLLIIISLSTIIKLYTFDTIAIIIALKCSNLI